MINPIIIATTNEPTIIPDIVKHTISTLQSQCFIINLREFVYNHNITYKLGKSNAFRRIDVKNCIYRQGDKAHGGFMQKNGKLKERF